MNKGIVLGMVILVIGMGFTGTSYSLSMSKSQMFGFDGNILYVGGNGTGNYSKIQDAIDNASDGDTVFVFDDSSPYKEYVVVDKSISLIGENKETTCIDCINISSDGVTVSGFNIQNSGEYDSGVLVRGDDNLIRGNIFTNIGIGVFIFNDGIIQRRNIITENIFYNIGYLAIGADKSYNSTISKNTISNCHIWGIALFGGYLNKVFLNSIKDIGNRGIVIMSSGYNNIYKNNIENCGDYGITIGFSYDIIDYKELIIYNKIVKNNIVNNTQGIDLELAAFTTIKENNFIGNQEEGNAEFSQCIGTRWKGNYWDDWDGTGWYKIKGDFSIIIGFDEYGPIWYVITVNNYDKRPARKPYNITTTQGWGIE